MIRIDVISLPFLVLGLLLVSAPPSTWALRTAEVTTRRSQRASSSSPSSGNPLLAAEPHHYLDRVFFTHMPKTGGTTMRFILTRIMEYKKSQQQFFCCYPDVDCEGTNGQCQNFTAASFMMEPAAAAGTAGTKLVYGHGVRPGQFEKYWGLEASGAGDAWIRFFREPVPLLISTYRAKLRHETGEQVPSFSSSALDEYVRQGLMEEAASNITWNYLLRDPDWASRTPAALRADFEAALLAPNSLTLRTDQYDQSVGRLARFLGVPELEETLLDIAHQAYNTHGKTSEEEEVEIQMDTMKRILDAAGPLQTAWEVLTNSEKSDGDGEASWRAIPEWDENPRRRGSDWWLRSYEAHRQRGETVWRGKMPSFAYEDED